MITLEFHQANAPTTEPAKTIFSLPQPADGGAGVDNRVRVEVHVRPPLTELNITGKAQLELPANAASQTPPDLEFTHDVSRSTKDTAIYTAFVPITHEGIYNVKLSAEKTGYRPSRLAGTFYCKKSAKR